MNQSNLQYPKKFNFTHKINSKGSTLTDIQQHMVALSTTDIQHMVGQVNFYSDLETTGYNPFKEGHQIFVRGESKTKTVLRLVHK
jgi:hypothetical protein